MKVKTAYLYFLKCIPAILLILFFVSEAFSKYSIIFLDGKSNIQRLVKVIVLIYFAINIIRPIKNLLFPTLLLAIFCIGQFFLADGFNQEIVVSFSKFLFPIFLFIYFNRNPLNEKSQNLLFLTFEYLLILNGILIFLGFIFEIPLFNSYKFGRWGYNGLFISTATSSYIYAVAIFYFLLNLKEKFLLNWKSLFILVCCVITGTKIIYLAIFGSLLIYLMQYTHLNRKQRNILLLSILTIFTALGYLLFFQWGIFNEIRQKQGIISAIFSFRDDLLMKETIPYIRENWNLANYLFGGISDLAVRSQMGFLDIFLFWGILGGLLYLITFYKTFVPTSLIKNGVYIILILALMVFLAGNFFENASVAIYLLILKEKLIGFTTVSNKDTLNE